MAATNRARPARPTAQRSELPWVMEEFLVELENFCPVQGVIPVPAQRSPLPVWYPRRPLQDITEILNSRHGNSAELLKKDDKKRLTCWSMEMEDRRTKPKVSKNPTIYTAAPIATRGSQLRKGFR